MTDPQVAVLDRFHCTSTMYVQVTLYITQCLRPKKFTNHCQMTGEVMTTVSPRRLCCIDIMTFVTKRIF